MSSPVWIELECSDRSCGEVWEARVRFVSYGEDDHDMEPVADDSPPYGTTTIECPECGRTGEQT